MKLRDTAKQRGARAGGGEGGYAFPFLVVGTVAEKLRPEGAA